MKYKRPEPPRIFAEQFTFPNAKDIKSLGLKHCNAIKNFTYNVMQDIINPHQGIFEDLVFHYHRHLQNKDLEINSLEKGT